MAAFCGLAVGLAGLHAGSIGLFEGLIWLAGCRAGVGLPVSDEVDEGS